MQRTFALLVLLALAVAGCSGTAGKKSGPSGDFALQVTDSLAGGHIELTGAYLRGPSGWVQALGNGTEFDFAGAGGNVSAAGEVPAGSYDRLRVAFSDVQSGGRRALLTQTGVEVAVNITVTKGGNTTVGLAFAWADSFFTSDAGLAFTPILSRLVVIVDEVETLRLEAGNISSGGGKAPVARMRVFDATGLEAFASTFVAESPEAPIIANAGNITFTATQSEALQPGTKLAKFTWDIEGEQLTGNTVKWPAPLNGGNFTARLTVEDSDGNSDMQTLKMALRPGQESRTLSFTGKATGVAGQGSTPGVHTFDVDAGSFNNASANLTHVKLVLTPGSATVPVSDLDVALVDGAGKNVGSPQTGSGSQHTINVDVKDPASGAWKATVTADPGYDATYTVTVTLTWTGVNPGMETFLAWYEDGHSHQH